ncbi:MAG: aldo/keto reductase [Candidatus Wallbacteria bacterium]|nr:aldo/keto reductase [Candidatus Wallbacteria bacterium]
MAQSSSGGLTVNGFSVPLILYGTAWKEDRTEALVELALKTGYRGIDTANQRRHYFEEGVGQAVQKAIASGLCRREELFLQTKFTYLGGQDHRLPYDPRASLATQVRQSMQSSLEHLGTDHVDSYVLHGPSSGVDWCPDDAEVWQAMSELKRAGQTRLLGVSNINLRQLHALCKGDGEKPSFVQNRCYARLGWDRSVRNLCKDRNITYQGFSLLTANPEVVNHSGIEIGVLESHSG